MLVKQRDSFLPLRVIRDKIEAGEHLEPEPEPEVIEAPEPDPDADSAILSGGELDETASALDTGPSTLALTIDELAAASDMTVDQVAQLETYGLIHSRPLGPSRYYDAE